MKTIYVTSAEQHELRPPKGGRSMLEIINDDAAEILFAEDTIASPENGIPVAANSSKLWDKVNGSVPQGSVWILGSIAGRQKVFIRER